MKIANKSHNKDHDHDRSAARQRAFISRQAAVVNCARIIGKMADNNDNDNDEVAVAEEDRTTLVETKIERLSRIIQKRRYSA